MHPSVPMFQSISPQSRDKRTPAIYPPFGTTPGKEPFCTPAFRANNSLFSVKTMQLTLVSNPHAKANSYFLPSSVGNTPSINQSSKAFNHQRKWLSQYPTLTYGIILNKHVIYSILFWLAKQHNHHVAKVSLHSLWLFTISGVTFGLAHLSGLDKRVLERKGWLR